MAGRHKMAGIPHRAFWTIRMTHEHVLMVTLVFVGNILLGWCHFGLTSRRRLDPNLTERPLPGTDTQRHLSAVDMCRLLKLRREQKHLCLTEPQIAPILLEAAVKSIDLCRLQFKYERWNCDLNRGRANLLKEGFRETAYLYALTSASLAHSFARACSQSRLDVCGCDVTDDVTALRVGSCSDNLREGVRLATWFLDSRGWEQDLQGQVNKYNNDVGLQLLISTQRRRCHCHGTSGSCTIQTCLHELISRRNISRLLKDKYDDAQLMISNKAKKFYNEVPISMGWNTGVVPTSSTNEIHHNSVSELPLLYTMRSPDYCRRSRYSSGTARRECYSVQQCNDVCCGRGFEVIPVEIVSNCHCVVKWCCDVKCQSCSENVEKMFCY